jgi:3',5'-cyclic AMP phosphodiesterase CpdA
MIRLAHFSDVHVTAPVLDWTREDWFNKRYAAWLNLRWLGRGRLFRRAEEVVRALAAELSHRALDHIVFSGDATALGFEAEMKRAADLLQVGSADQPAGLAVPGNHDYVTRQAAASGLFERYFAPWQIGKRVDETVYPFAQRVGQYWLIGVNSCTGNRWPWDAGGRVGDEQLERLRRLLESLTPGPRILVTHYPVYLASGRRELPWRNLRDLDRLLAVASTGGVCLWLHGHRHGAYHVAESSAAPFPVLCAGSATQRSRWSYSEYELEGRKCQVLRRAFDGKQGSFQDMERFVIQLPAGRRGVEAPP